jgi:hypothetical protein
MSTPYTLAVEIRCGAPCGGGWRALFKKTARESTLENFGCPLLFSQYFAGSAGRSLAAARTEIRSLALATSSVERTGVSERAMMRASACVCVRVERGRCCWNLPAALCRKLSVKERGAGKKRGRFFSLVSEINVGEPEHGATAPCGTVSVYFNVASVSNRAMRPLTR